MSITKKIASALFLLCFGLFVLEIVSKELFHDDPYVYPADKSIFVRDYFKHYYRKPNTTRYYRHPDLHYRIELKSNSLGLLNKPVNINKKPGVMRIAIIGDSVTDNLGVEERFRMPLVMERILKKTNPQAKIEVINCGVTGYGTTQQYNLYQEIVKPLKPDIVLLQHCANDFGEIHASQLYKLKKGQLVSTRSLLPESNFFFQAINKTAIARLLQDRLFQPKINKVNDLLQSVIDQKDEGTKTLNIYRTTLKKFRDEVESNGGIFAGLLFFDGKVLWGREVEKYRAYQKIICDTHEQLNIPYLDWSERWSPEKHFSTKQLKGFYFVTDPHWNEIGNQIAAIDTLNFLNNVLTLDWKSIKYDPQLIEKNPLYKQLPFYHHSFPSTLNILYDYLIKKLPVLLHQPLLNRSIKLIRYTKLTENSHVFEFRLPTNQHHFDQVNQSFDNSAWHSSDIDLYDDIDFHDLFSRSPKNFYTSGRRFAHKHSNVTIDVFISHEIKNMSDGRFYWGVMQIKLITSH